MFVLSLPFRINVFLIIVSNQIIAVRTRAERQPILDGLHSRPKGYKLDGGKVATVTSEISVGLQRLQNWAARLVFQVRRDTPPDPLLCNLHWLPVKQRIIFKLLLLVYKSLQLPLNICLIV